MGRSYYLLYLLNLFFLVFLMAPGFIKWFAVCAVFSAFALPAFKKPHVGP